MKKKIISLCLVAALVVVAIAGTSLAYFTDKDAKTNTFTLGNVDIELNEENWEEPIAAVPDVKYDKDPVVTNIGENDAWIRVDVTLSDAAAFTAAAAKHQITDLATIFAGHDEVITLSHSAGSKEVFAAGAVNAAVFLKSQKPGLYDMKDLVSAK